jgi:hypothetical protein
VSSQSDWREIFSYSTAGLTAWRNFSAYQEKVAHEIQIRTLPTRYYDFNVWTAKKETEKLKYLHRNPVTRGLVAKPEVQLSALCYGLPGNR